MTSIARWSVVAVALALARCGTTSSHARVERRPAPAGDRRGVAPCADGVAPWVPFIAGEFVRAYAPPGTRYLNDHTVVRDDDGTFHVIGITHESMGMPHRESAFLHASARRVEGPWRPLPDALLARAPEENLWAPHVVRRGPRAWTMYYYGNTPDHRVLRADSDDLATWRRHPASAPGGRDPFALRDGGAWRMYSVGVGDDGRGQIIVTTSPDLVAWSPLRVAVEDPTPSLGWGNLESPCVVARDGWYYLFLTQTSESIIDYVRTLVFASRDPVRFRWAPITVLFGHAAEVLRVDDRWYITSAGWTGYVGARWRGLSIAPLAWAPRCTESPAEPTPGVSLR